MARRRAKPNVYKPPGQSRWRQLLPMLPFFIFMVFRGYMSYRMDVRTYKPPPPPTYEYIQDDINAHFQNLDIETNKVIEVSIKDDIPQHVYAKIAYDNHEVSIYEVSFVGVDIFAINGEITATLAALQRVLRSQGMTDVSYIIELFQVDDEEVIAKMYFSPESFNVCDLNAINSYGFPACANHITLNTSYNTHEYWSNMPKSQLGLPEISYLPESRLSLPRASYLP